MNTSLNKLDRCAIDRQMRFADSYTRLPKLLELLSSSDPLSWWEKLGEEWSCCDNIGLHLAEVRRLLKNARREHVLMMMDSNEKTAWELLPKSIKVFRGCYDFNQDGLSWSMSRDVAQRFPSYWRYRHPDRVPLLLVGDVQKDDCILKLDRNEQEIICHTVKVEVIA